MRAFVPLAALAVVLGACAPTPRVDVTVYPKPTQPRHVATIVAPVGQVDTVRRIRPDATGYFPGDSTVLRRHSAEEAAHIGGGVVRAAPVPSGAKYTPSTSKYTPPSTSKYTLQVPVHQQVVVQPRPLGPLDCYVVSQSRPEAWVGKRFGCVER